MAQKMWFGTLVGKRGNEVPVRVRRNGGLNAGDSARFGGVKEVAEWVEVEASTVAEAKALIKAGKGTPCGAAPAPVLVVEAPTAKPKRVKGAKKAAA